MALTIPNLDDTTYEALVKEARALIVRYAPDWTDHNVHDPGITFLELFAWLAEMQIYRLNLVTDNHYRKFFKLAGYVRKEAQPSRVLIDFNGVSQEILVAGGAPVVAEVAGEKYPFLVETDTRLMPVSLQSVTTGNGTGVIDRTRANQEDGVHFPAFGEEPVPGSYLVLELDAPLPQTEFQITFILSEENLPAPGSHGDEPADTTPSITLAWEYGQGGTWQPLNVVSDDTLALTVSGSITFARPEGAKNDAVQRIRCRIRDGAYEIPPLVIRIQVNAVSAVQIENRRNEDLGASSGAPDQQFRLQRKPIIRKQALDHIPFQRRDVIDWPGLLTALKNASLSADSPPQKRIWDNLGQDAQALIDEWHNDPSGEQEKTTVAIESALTETLNTMMARRDLYDGRSFGLSQLPADAQRLAERLDILSDEEVISLNRFLTVSAFAEHIINGRPVIQVEGTDSRWETWIEVDDFEASGPDDSHYLLDPDKGEITFGNGLNGRIPSKDRRIRAFLYQTTLGVKGNIPKGQVWRIESSGPGVPGIAGINTEPSNGGRDAETIDHAKEAVRKDLRTPYRTVTSQDYEELALSTPGLRVARAKALVNFSPDYPCTAVPGVVTVVAVPYVRGEQTRPVPSEGFLQTVLRHLDKHRLVTTDIRVIGPEYVEISVSCKVRIKKRSSLSEVKNRIDGKLRDFLRPLKSRPDQKDWPFGRSVFPSEIYEQIDGVEGVDYVTGLSLGATGRYWKEPGGAVRIAPWALVYPGVHNLVIE